MATVVLTTVGQLLGGPIGAAIGALAGRAFDQAVLFKPKGREGPRLTDLAVQTSSYGSQISALFGTIRVAGTVIWAMNLKESREKSGGGKGRPSVTSYAYSASFAVALSSRPIRAIRRIWADGNLLRGAAGDFKTELGAMRVHLGHEDQPVDPLIASAQGVGETPAHRGVAYVLFEDLALGDYGNRIPSLTFEVEADEGAVSIGAVAQALTGGAVAGDGLATVAGYAASGGDARAALSPLVEAHGLSLAGDRLVADGEAAAEVGGDALVRAVNGKRREPAERRSAAADGVPVTLALRHHDAARDYQAGVQKVTRPGPGRIETGMDLPAVIGPARARQLAAQRLDAAWAGRDEMTLCCGWDALDLAPGAMVTVAGEGGSWRIEAREWEAMAVVLTLRRAAGGGAPSGEVASGGIVREVDAPHGPTILMLVDLPPLGESAASGPVIVAAASGGAGWRRASLLSLSDMGEATPLGRTAPRAVMGVVDVPPGVASSLLIDRIGAMEVSLLAQDMVLADAEEAALEAGRNLAMVGRELIQFARAEAIGPARWRLSDLRRGLRGTEWAMTEPAAGAPFLLLEEDRLFSLPDALLSAPAVRIAALGIGDVEPAEAVVAIDGAAIRPPSPVHLAARDDGAGGASFSWTRRSRAGWRWIDGVDAPLVEEAERYMVALADGAGIFRRAQVAAPTWTWDAAARAEDMAAGHGGPWTFTVRQMGVRAIGRPAVMTINP